MSIYGKYKPTLQLILDGLLARLNNLNHAYQKEHQQTLFEHLIGRIKSEESMVEKCKRKNLTINPYSALRQNRDSIGIRLVCNFIDDIYQCINLIEQMPDIKIVTRKDYITNAKPNGYRSYHLIVDVQVPQVDINGASPGHFFVEIQLRTIAMDTWASLEHEMKYKHKITHEKLISNELKRVSDELASCDVNLQTIRNLIKEEDITDENFTG